MDLNNPDAIRLTLESHSGKRVKVRLASGQEIEGKIAKVGAVAVVLAEVTGMEFFDATVLLDQMAAMLVRTRSR